jgi:hypothetical protein
LKGGVTKYNGSFLPIIMPFPVDEQQASIAKLGQIPTVSTRQGFQQDQSVILQLGLANVIVSIEEKNGKYLQSSQMVVKQCVEKLDVGWVLYKTNSGEDVFLFITVEGKYKIHRRAQGGRTKPLAVYPLTI